MASWLRINDDIAINADQVSHVQFQDDEALVWFCYCIEDEEHGLIPDAVLVAGEDATRLRRYLARRGDDVRAEMEG